MDFIMASLYMYVLWVKHASLPCLFLPPNSGLPSYFKTVHLLLSYVSFLNCISCTWESHMLLPLVPPCDWRVDPVLRSTRESTQTLAEDLAFIPSILLEAHNGLSLQLPRVLCPLLTLRVYTQAKQSWKI